MQQTNRFGNVFIILAAVVIVFAGIKAASAIIIPFLLALFLAIILMPLLHFLMARKIPMALAMLMLIGVLLLFFALFGVIVGHATNDFIGNLPGYEADLRSRLGGVAAWLTNQGMALPEKNLQSLLDPGAVFAYMTGALKGFGSILTNGFVILLTTVFMLLEGVAYRNKIAFIYRRNNSEGQKHLNEILAKINHYMALKALISAGTGFLVYLLLLLFGLDYPVLWGVVAFLLNFIPNIGSIMAAVPAVLLALLQLDLASAFWIAAGYVVINVLVGSVIEPKVMGRGLDLSTLVVFLSLIFWGWLLGPVGMLLSIPLTIMVKIVFDSEESTRWIAVLLGTGGNGQAEEA
ncbi:AI-2E family transporter [Sulfurimonas sp. HSL1-2]|uniref:AI-2E family transporter n=1 Tax=Thiomicrolovo zhangzhouensis TaxID=3131933 RepID=UPI0031F9183A